MAFRIQSDFSPMGDQPQAIDQLAQGIEQGYPHQTLLGVTGSGKTFTMANVIAEHQHATAPGLVEESSPGAASRQQTLRTIRQQSTSPSRPASVHREESSARRSLRVRWIE